MPLATPIRELRRDVLTLFTLSSVITNKTHIGTAMQTTLNSVIIIPARMGSTRLPGKPLADIHGKPMIVRVAEQAHAANIGRVVIATDSLEVLQAVENAGIEGVLTRADHESGSDRIYEALQKMSDSQNIDTVVNVQGDLPNIDPELIKQSLRPLVDGPADIATLGVEIIDESEKTNPNVVKIIGSPIAEDRLRALYFTRATAPYGEGPLYHHIGLYAYRRAALERFVSLQPSPLELREKLEQLRALEAGMRIEVELVKTVPLGVDTPEDLDRARKLIEQ